MGRVDLDGQMENICQSIPLILIPNSHSKIAYSQIGKKRLLPNIHNTRCTRVIYCSVFELHLSQPAVVPQCLRRPRF